MMKHGPVDVIVMAAGEPRFDGSVLAELEKQTEKGTIQVLDAMVLFKDESGGSWRLDFSDLPEEQAEAVDFISTETQGLFDEEDEDTLAEGMVPGSAIFALAIEHTWAVELVNALYAQGVEEAVSFRVPAPIVDEAFASLSAE